MTQRSSILRLDLRLRAAFPHVRTEIHELGPYHHLIYAPREQLDASEFAPVFANEYRTVGDRVEFTNERPTSSVVLKPIRDSEIGSELEGIPFTESDLATILAGKFPGVPTLVRVTHGSAGELRLSFESELPAGSVKQVRSFLTRCVRGQRLEIDVAEPVPEMDASMPMGAGDAINSIGSLSFKPIRRRAQVPSFIAQEEEWWFANIENLFAGLLTPRSFEFIRGAGMACYLNCAVSPQIDVRQVLLAYDTIYMELPIEVGASSEFWDSQSITKEDLLRLIEVDRIRVLHSQPEERFDLGFLREARETNPRGVVGRRMSAAMMIADVVETANEYIFNQASLADSLEKLIERLAADTGAPNDEIARLLLYPIQAVRECFEPMLRQGLLAYHAIGQGDAFARVVKRVSGRNVSLESGAFGASIHVAHMLDATFIPQVPHDGYVGTWLEPMRFMGDRLNFYRSFNTRIAAAWAVNERRKEERLVILPSIPIFDIDPEIPIDEFIAITSIGSDRRKGRALLTRLANLPAEQRSAEIECLRKEWSELSRTTEAISNTTLFLDAGFNLATYALGLNVFPFLPALTLTKYALEYSRQFPALDPIADEIERAFNEQVGRNEDLSILSKVSRVGRLVR